MVNFPIVDINSTKLLIPLIPVLESIITNITKPVGVVGNFGTKNYLFHLTGERAGKTIKEFVRGKWSFKNPRFWVRSASTMCTGSAALCCSYYGVMTSIQKPVFFSLPIAQGFESMANFLDRVDKECLI